MKITEVLLESIIGGALTMAAVAFILWSFIPAQMSLLFQAATDSKDLSVPLATAILTAAAYAVGQIAEYGSLELFEWRLTRIKRNRLREFIEAHSASLTRSATLAEFSSKAELSLDEARSKVGQMRFEILHQSERLYAEIESQLRRMRLVRILFVVELLTLIGVLCRICTWPSGVVTWCLSLLAVLLGLTWMAIGHRFHFYCRAIERSYAILFFS